MIALLLPLLAAAAVSTGPAKPAPATGGDARLYAACTSMLDNDAKAAGAFADDWRTKGGGTLAAQCLGLAYAAQGRWAPAVAAFEQGAQSAERESDGRAANLWAQAANAALALDDAARARPMLERALTFSSLDGLNRGEALLDLARADVALGRPTDARTALDQAQPLVPQDPLLWLLSATLARRQKDLPRAEKDIAEAMRLSPDDASVAFEAGNIAATAGRDDAALLAWRQARTLSPDSDAGKAAARALAQNGG